MRRTLQHFVTRNSPLGQRTQDGELRGHLGAADDGEQRAFRLTEGTTERIELGGKQLPAMKMRITKLLKAFKPLPYGKATIEVGGDEVEDIPENE